MAELAPDLDAVTSENSMAEKIISAYERALYLTQYGKEDDALEIYRWVGRCGVHEGWVYFVRCDRFIKIGHSMKPIERAASLFTTLPMPSRLLATTQGGRDKEQKLHRRFRQSHIRYEWFHPSEALFQYIREQANLLVPKEAIA